MTYNPSKTQNWTRSTPADGDAYDDEFDRIYANTAFLKSEIERLETELATAENLQVPLGSVVTDDLNFLPNDRFKDANAQAVNRADLAPELLAKLIKTVTSITIATDRINVTSHGKAEGDLIKFAFTGGGITALTHYYVRNPTANNFQISTTSSGSIINLTADQTGEILTHVGWGFGNGSTTINVPDDRGIFERGAGVHGRRAKGGGGNYDGGAVGFEGQDRFQGFHRQGNQATVNSNSGTPIPVADEGFGSKNLTGIVSDGINGTPRTGNETTPAWVSRRRKVRIK